MNNEKTVLVKVNARRNWAKVDPDGRTADWSADMQDAEIYAETTQKYTNLALVVSLSETENGHTRVAISDDSDFILSKPLDEAAQMIDNALQENRSLLDWTEFCPDSKANCAQAQQKAAAKRAERANRPGRKIMRAFRLSA